MAGRARALRRLLVAGLAALVLLAACGDDDGTTTGTTGPPEETDGGATTTTEGPTETTTGELTASFRGVEADSIKLGIVIIDYEAIKDFVDFHRGDQQTIAQYFVDWINENGGVGGRMIVPFYKTYPPIPGMEPSPQAICTEMTDDEQVFAVLGVFIDFTGEGQLCLSRDKETIHIGHELEQEWIDEAIPGLLLTPDRTKELNAELLLNLLDEEGMLEGRTVAIVADQDSESRMTGIVEPKLDELGVDRGSTAILTITGTDTSAAQAQLDSFIERWRSEGVDTIFFGGLTASAKQFVDKIGPAFPDALLLADASAVVNQGQDSVSAGGPNYYVGMISVEGETASQRWANKPRLLQECVDVYEAASGERLLGPDEVQPEADGRTAQLYVTVTDFCGELLMFKTIAEAAGPNLTNDSWIETVNSFGDIELVSTGIASLCEGKYAADDEARLVEFDPTVGERGDWAPLTDLMDASDECG
jgi:hypothetical protein